MEQHCEILVHFRNVQYLSVNSSQLGSLKPLECLGQLRVLSVANNHL